MVNIDRIIDVNLNRTAEGLRILEETARFILDHRLLSENLKSIRHKILLAYKESYNDLVNARDTENDVGRDMPNPSDRHELSDVIMANFSRVKQSVRSLEEYAKLNDTSISAMLESQRYEIYTLEKKMNQEIHRLYRKKRLENARLYLVTDRTKFTSDDAFYNALASAISGGVDIVQLREKTATAKDFMRIAKTSREICAAQDVLFIVNDRVDIAQAVDADGVHLGQDDIDIATARKMLGDQAIIGNSTHKPEDALNAMENGADYIGVGPVFTTPTKPGRQAVGLDYVHWASKNVTIPFYAIGGISPDNVDQVIEAGATRVAIVRAIINAEDPAKISQSVKNSLLKEAKI